MKGKVTVQEIADFVGVSKFAVSRALAGKSGVSEKTRDTILQAAAELGYFKNRPKRVTPAPAPEGGGSWKGNILVLFPNIRFQNRDSLYWGPIFDGVSARLNEKGIDIITLTEPSTEDIFSLINPDAVSGVITVGTVSSSILTEIDRLKIPVVMIDHMDPVLKCDTVFTDNFMSINEIMNYLLNKGYRDFQFVGYPGYAPSFRERWTAYRAFLEEKGIEGNQAEGLISPAREELAQTIMDMKPRELPEVFLCANDIMASFTIEALTAKGIKVPGRCVVTGFDNLNEELPLLATAEVNKEQLGMRAVDQILWRIQNPHHANERKMVSTEIIVHEENGMKH
ncbi:LacI family DNA-binding transcriptional regulator [Paenibacillus sp. YPG26]|uniref:LacI family DNA-binding transcriptional regulator n=1 Tax=Paenibacillus sp. YPG26 TaxID=2878915 RepID=UPI00203FAC74|nr:LacI family DNA-binding transcriptional regulator [Paenibacillus sp. YPG26]USB33645.1 LacI family DNA-binding transcriptional regulator [Paenibacillus sp. YPG26]